MKVNLNELAAELAKMDEPARLNVDVAQAKAVLGALGRELRGMSPDQCTAVVAAIVCRAGKRGAK